MVFKMSESAECTLTRKNWERKAVFTLFSTSDSGPWSIWEFYTFKTFTKSHGHSSSSLYTHLFYEGSVQAININLHNYVGLLCLCSTLAVNEHQVKVARCWFSGAAGSPLWGAQVVPASSQNDPLQGTAEPHRQGGGTLGKTCFRKGRA